MVGYCEPNVAAYENDYQGRSPSAKEAFGSCMNMALAMYNVQQAGLVALNAGTGQGNANAFAGLGVELASGRAV